MLRIIGKALSKAPETRYQTGRELADDLLAITRPGFVPTLRARETPTLPPDTPPGDVPTISSPATAQSPPTIGSAATAAAAPTVAPTILTPGTARTGPPPLPAQTAAPPVRTPRPPVSTAPRRKGGGAGLIVGLGVVGLLFLALVLGGGWFMLRRGAATPAGPDVAQATPVPTASPVAPADAGASRPVEAVPAPVATTAPTRATAGGPAVVPARPAGQDAAPPGSTAAAPVPTQAEPAGGAFAHLDELPPDQPDGRALGAAAGRSYGQSGTSSFGTTRRFPARQRVPPGLTRAELPGAGALLYLHSVEEAYHRRHGRYATLGQLHDAGMLVLDVALDASGFKRRGYAFSLAVEPDGYRAEAVPLGGVGRALVVDDVGRVRFRDRDE
jgi:hypothetical protein